MKVARHRVALVTGAQGFVGRYLIAELLASDPALEVIGIGRSEATTTFTHDITIGDIRIRAPLPAELQRSIDSGRYHYRQADLRDATQVYRIFEQYAPQYVYHLASGLRDDSPEHLFSTGVEGTIALLNAAADAPAVPQAVVIASSGSVYGLPEHLPISETQACEPRDFYAVCKLAQEHVSRIVARERSLPLRIGRIFNVVGPGQDERHAAGRFCAQISAVSSGTSEPKIVVGDLTPTRDFIDVRDTAGGLIAIAHPDAPNETYNIASGIEHSIQEVLDSLLHTANLDGAITIDNTYQRPSDTPRTYADITRLRLLGFAARFPIEQSLRDLFMYYRAAIEEERKASTP